MRYRADVRMIKAIADENRLKILECLHNGEQCACIILEKLSITQSTLSHHMKILCDCGLVNARKQGRWMYYSISENGRDSFRDIISHYLDADLQASICKCDKCE